MKKKTKKGFTLMEMLLYTALLSVVVLIVSGFFLWIVQSYAKARAIREVSDNARRATEILSLEIKESESLYTPTSVFNASSGQLSLKTTKYLPSGETQTYIDFFICDERLCLKKEGQSPLALTTDRVEVNNLEFSMVATTSTLPSVRINLKIDYKNPSGKPEYRASYESTSTVSQRAY